MDSLFTIITAEYKKPLTEDISDACFKMPAPGRTNSDHVGDRLAYRIYNWLNDNSPPVDSQSTILERAKARAVYNKFKDGLRTRYTKQQTDKRAKPKTCVLTIHHKARTSLAAYQEAKTLPVSDLVLNPVPMPVDISPASELVDFFARVSHESKAEPVRIDKIGQYEEYKRGAYYTDGRIDLCKQVVGPTHIANLMSAIRDNAHIKHFLIGNNIIGAVGADAIAAFISDPTRRANIGTWYLAGNCIDATGIAKIAHALSTDTHCTQLWLKRNPLQIAGAVALANMLRSNTRITVLDLNNTAIMDEGCIELFAALAHNTTLETLYIDANALGVPSAEAIAAYIHAKAARREPGIVRLSVCMNRLGDRGAQLIADALRTTGYPMQTLFLSSNRIEVDGLRSILAYASEAKTLDVLDIGHYKATADMGELPNCFGVEGSRLIAEFIRSNPPLRMLSLFTCFLDKQVVIDAARENDRMICIHIENMPNPSRSNYAGSDAEYNALIRKMRHGDSVWAIDSIYRNNM